MGGGLMQLVAYGAQDVYLTGNPQITFFKTTYRRHTNFSMECIRQTLEGTVAAGNRVVAKLARNGDLVHDCFIKVPSYLTSDNGAKGNSNPGHNMLDFIECEIGGQLIDKHYGHWMEAHAELTEVGSNCGRTNDMQFGDNGLNSYLTNSDFQRVAFAGGVLCTSSTGRIPTHYVPLRFWFCRHIGLSLPLIALQYHEVNINIKFTEHGGLWDTSGAYPTGKPNMIPELWCNYIYLDTDERRRFAQVSHEYLVEQVQLNNFTMIPDSQNKFALNLNHPVKELVWVVMDGGNNAWGGVGTDNTNKSGQFVPIGTPSDGNPLGGGNDKWYLKLNS